MKRYQVKMIHRNGKRYKTAWGDLPDLASAQGVIVYYLFCYAQRYVAAEIRELGEK